MKEYIEQFYSEGFATTFYLKPVNWIENRIKNKILSNIIKKIIKILYTVTIIIFALVVLYLRWPF